MAKDEEPKTGKDDEAVDTEQPPQVEVRYSPIFNPSSEISEDDLMEQVSKFNEADFDDKFDDDFEAEIAGEYELEDDEYGEEFAEVEEMIGMRASKKCNAGDKIVDEELDEIDEDD